jgi:hypothetical protein
METLLHHYGWGKPSEHVKMDAAVVTATEMAGWSDEQLKNRMRELLEKMEQ